MLGDLNKKEIIDLLERQVVGRLGCHANNETYIVPLNFVYQNNAIYAHSGAGKKVDMMRINSKVCFQVDEIHDAFRWKSAIVWGTFEELQDEERQQALQGIIIRIMQLRDKPTLEPSHAIPAEFQDNLIVYKINITEATGRFETHD